MNIDKLDIDIFTRELKKVAQLDALILETKDQMKPYQDRLKQLKFEKKNLKKNCALLCKKII